MSRRMVLVAAALCALTGCTGGSPSAPGGPKALVIGLVNNEDSPLGSFPDLRRGAVVAERYVNAHGGVDGRPIRLVACTTTGTPESSQACANKLVAQHPVSVIGGVDVAAASTLPVLRAAHIPYVGGTPAATEALTSSGSFMLTGGTATEALAEVSYAKQTLHADRLAVVYSNLPGLLSQAASLLTAIAHQAGIDTVKLFPVEPGTPDVTPVLSAAASIHPQAVIAVFASQDCARIMQGIDAVGLTARMLYPSFCGAQSVLTAVGTAADDSVVASGYLPYTDSSDPDVATYLSALHTYDPSLQPSLLSQAGFSDVVVLSRVIAGIGAHSVTPAMVATALHHTRPGFMSHAFTCDGRQISVLPALCNAYVQLSVVSHGQLKPFGSWVDTAPVARLATG